LRDRPDVRLVFFSSSYVYSGLDSSVPLPEETTLRPDHDFGVAKCFFEQLIARTHPNSVILRLSSVFGHGNPRHPNVVQNMARDCRDRGEVVIWGSGARRMQFIYLEDTIRYILRSLSVQPGTYNLAGNEYESVADTAKSIAAHFGAEVRFLTEKREGQTLPFLANSKLCRACGVDDYTPFPEALRRFLDTFNGA
jgi:nucleoside-diphosphate-sugar epimerase